MNLYTEVMDVTDLKTTTRIHNLAKGAELRSNMLLCGKLHELQNVMEEVWNIAEICLADEQRYAVQHTDER